MNKKQLIAALMVGILLFNGCAVIGYRTDATSYKNGFDDISPGIYPCVRLDIDIIKKITKGEEETVFFLFKPIVLLLYTLDIGVSFIFDTIGLPYDIYRTRKYTEDKNTTTVTEEVKDSSVAH